MTDWTKTICPPIFDLGGIKLIYTFKPENGYFQSITFWKKNKLTE